MPVTKSKKLLAIIPARGGSKRLPKKNVLPFAGRPLISWTIDAALSSLCFDSIVVSSDDEPTLSIARRHGVLALRRPTALATDHATTLDVVLHTLDSVSSNAGEFDAVVVLQPTSPLRTADDISQAVQTFRHGDAASVISVCPVDHPVEWTMELGSAGQIDDFAQAASSIRSQDLPPRYRLNGAICITAVDAIRDKRSFLPSPSYAYVMPRERSFDIDTELDFFLCESIMKKQAESGNVERPACLPSGTSSLQTP